LRDPDVADNQSGIMIEATVAPLDSILFMYEGLSKPLSFHLSIAAVLYAKGSCFLFSVLFRKHDCSLHSALAEEVWKKYGGSPCITDEPLIRNKKGIHEYPLHYITSTS
jgi:hypothetical protein